MSRQKTIIGTHTAPDVDAIVSIWLLEKYGDPAMQKASHLFLKGGDEALNTVAGITLVDRGHGKFDHHGRYGSRETSASLIAKEIGVAKEKGIPQLLDLVRRNDLEGLSEPFDITDIIKCIQRNKEIGDEEKIGIGVRVVNDVMGLKCSRDNQYVREIIVDFLKDRKVPQKFFDYLQKLSDPVFKRPFDLVEIMQNEKADRGKSEAIKFIQKLLEILYRDSGTLYWEAEREAQEAMKDAIIVRGQVIVSYVTDNPKFNAAARALGATIIIQRNIDGHVQIYFKTRKVNDKIVETLVSVIRLEECLVQGREIPQMDLQEPERIEEIPEWYYFKAPWGPGRFIFNGSLTAPDVPVTKISSETIREIVREAVQCQPLNWMRWKTERIAKYTKQKA